MAAGSNDSFTKVMLTMDGSNGGTTFNDSNVGGSAHTWSVGAGTVTTSTSSPKFGSAGALFSVGYITTPDHADFDLGSGDWTIDFWVKRATAGTLITVAGQDTGTTTSSSFTINFPASNVLSFGYNYNGANGDSLATTGFTITNDSTWHHVAIVRNGVNLTIYFDGSQVAQATNLSGRTFNNSTGPLVVGRAGNAGNQFNGGIDEFRLSVGVARWTAPFTPETVSYRTEGVMAAAGAGALSGTGRVIATSVLAAAGVGAFTPDPTGSGINAGVLSATGSGTFRGVALPPPDVIGRWAAYSVEGHRPAYTVQGSVELP